MSIRVMSQVWDSDLTDIYEASVLLALANHADDDGRCYPSMARVARLARCSLRKAQDVTKALAERGYLRVELNSGPRGCNTYFLTLTSAKDAPRTMCTPARHDRNPRTPRHHPPHSVHPNRQRTIKEPARVRAQRICPMRGHPMPLTFTRKGSTGESPYSAVL